MRALPGTVRPRKGVAEVRVAVLIQLVGTVIAQQGVAEVHAAVLGRVQPRHMSAGGAGLGCAFFRVVV